MPIYEYRCDKGHTLEVMQRMSDEPLASCTTCHAPVQRVFHPVAVHFKGSGFYATDYGRNNSKGSEESNSKGDTDSKGSSSDDSKPASKSDKAGSGSDNSASKSKAESKS